LYYRVQDNFCRPISQYIVFACMCYLATWLQREIYTYRYTYTHTHTSDARGAANYAPPCTYHMIER